MCGIALTKKSLLLHLRSSRLCALSVWLVADYDLEFYYAEFGFLLALGTVQRKIKPEIFMQAKAIAIA